MNFLTNLSIRNKLILAFSLVLTAAIALGLFSITRVKYLNGTATTIVQNDALNVPLYVITDDINEISALAAVEHAASAGAQLQSVDSQEQAVVQEELRNWTLYAPTMDPGLETDEGNTVQADFKALAASFDKIGALDAAQDHVDADALVLGQLQDQTKAARVAMAADFVYQTNQSNQIAAASQAAATSSVIWITVAVGLMLVLAVLIILAIVKLVARPIGGMTEVMRRLAGSDFQVTVPGLGRKDEIGAMAGAVEVFKDAGLEKLRLASEMEASRAIAEEERRRNEAEREQAGLAQQRVVNEIAAGLEKLSAGNLQFRLNTPFSAEYEKLRTDFNTAMATLAETMGSIAVHTQAVRAGSGEITNASDDLSRRTEHQAASLEETAAALDKITETVRDTASGAKDARDVVTAAKRDAEHSGEVVRETVKAVSGIEESSSRISNIIGVIDEIAFQTNLLALNAGIEAARAGDAGRGFAVVATEVRALAQRSADAAKEIKALISTSGQQVETGVRLVGETGAALARIVEQVARLNDLVSSIAAAAQDQATGLAEVNIAVNQMDQVTQQNAAMVEETTAASHSLTGEAAELARLVGKFQIGQGEEPQAKRPILGKPPAPSAKAQGSVVRLRSNTALATSNSESWHEF